MPFYQLLNKKKHLLFFAIIFVFIFSFGDSLYLVAADNDKNTKLVNVNVDDEYVIPYIIMPYKTGPFVERLEGGDYKRAMRKYLEEDKPKVPDTVKLGRTNKITNTAVDITLMNTKNASLLVPTTIRIRTHKKIIKITLNLYMDPYSENYYILQLCGAMSKKEMILSYDISLQAPKNYLKRDKDLKMDWVRTDDNYSEMPLTPSNPKIVRFPLSLKHVSGKKDSCSTLGNSKIYILTKVDIVEGPEWIEKQYHPKLLAISFNIKEFYAGSGLYIKSITKLSGMLYTKKEADRLIDRLNAVVVPDWMEDAKWDKIRFSLDEEVLKCWKGEVKEDKKGFEYGPGQYIKMETGKIVQTSKY